MLTTEYNRATDDKIGYGIVGTLGLIFLIVLICIKLGCIQCWECPDGRTAVDHQSQTESSLHYIEMPLGAQSEVPMYGRKGDDVVWPEFHSV